MAVEICRQCGELYRVDARFPHQCRKTGRRKPR